MKNNSYIKPTIITLALLASLALIQKANAEPINNDTVLICKQVPANSVHLGSRFVPEPTLSTSQQALSNKPRFRTQKARWKPKQGKWQEKLATSKQISFIMSLCRKTKQPYPDFNNLSRGDASNLIDQLKEQ